MSNEKNTVIVSFDESNHGAFPEIMVALISDYKRDLKEEDSKLSKYHPHSKDLAWSVLKSLGKRKYTFLQAEENDYKRLGTNIILGVSLTSLIYQDINFKKYNSLYLLVDGEWKEEKGLFLKQCISDNTIIKKKDIFLKTGKNLDLRYKSVNMADRLAYALFRYGGSPENMSKRLERRTFLE
ncbi:MAG: hypothetical protein ACOC3Z_03700 [Nanoarchaeota archaeon]